MSNVIETHHLTRRFDGQLAVDDLTLQVAGGEVFALLGPNGAGKTTTVRMLACLIAPTGGHATVVGRDLAAECDSIRARVGLLTESPGLYEALTAWQNLIIFARLYGVANPAAQVEKYLKLLDLWDRRDEPTGGFSKGMKQKVAIARALLHEPELIFLDEPTSGLDPAAARTVREFLEQLKASGRTIFLTTHNLDEAERLADRIGVLKTHLVAVDTPDALRHRLFGRRTVVALAQTQPALVEVAARLPFVRQATLRDGSLVVDLGDPDRENPALVTALVQAGAQIRTVVEERASLEDVYLQLVSENPEEGAG
ncbi:MAG: ABC transporter ATP-binding protein [Ardenticatenaceae bacterium]|nr:ABC transporter ATP-binding protein [Ardenticatenaceae bacterium]HBY93930.1 multidrug ABC transporter ATP-binding protein [Chloroflexota bacterium]